VPEPDKLEKTVPNPLVDFALHTVWELISCFLKLIIGIIKAEAMFLNYIVDAILSAIGIELPFLQWTEQVMLNISF
jgi:hypothetical protein